jgi:hypothetical protein
VNKSPAELESEGDLNVRIERFIDSGLALINQLESFSKEDGAQLFLAIINDDRLPQWARDVLVKSAVGML